MSDLKLNFCYYTRLLTHIYIYIYIYQEQAERVPGGSLRRQGAPREEGRRAGQGFRIRKIIPSSTRECLIYTIEKVIY